MQMVVTLYCLGNKDKKKSLNMFNIDVTRPEDIFTAWLADSVDAEPTDTQFCVRPQSPKRENP